MNVIVTGIGTDVGKTVVSAILCEALYAEYWKPIQAGDLDHSDTDRLGDLVSHAGFKSHPEAFRLSAAMSPHAAADREGLTITPSDISRPDTNGEPLVTELAGGLMVPISREYLMVDLIRQLDDPIVLVANYYLGSINHTLLSIDFIKKHGLNFGGIIFNGETNVESRDVILEYANIPLIAEIPFADPLDGAFVKTHAEQIQIHSKLARL